jgi:integrase/recombinase XerD
LQPSEGMKITVINSKSANEAKVIFVPEQVASRLRTYIQIKGLRGNYKVCNLCYSTARMMINRLGKKVCIRLNPHDLRWHSTTFASRSGVPLEIISKILFRHQNLKTTQVYLGKVSDSEAIRWIVLSFGFILW